MGPMIGILLLAVSAAAAAAPQDERSFLLIAKKGMQDPFFQDSVVLVTRQPAAVGVILNKPLDVPLSRIFTDREKLRARDQKVFFGGPVKRDELVFVFRAATAPKNAVQVLDGVYMSADRDLLLQLLERDGPPGTQPPAKGFDSGLRVYAGHSGWAPGQLEAELARGSWHVAPAAAALVFHPNPKGLWRHLEQKASATLVRGPAPGQPLGEPVLPAFVTR